MERRDDRNTQIAKQGQNKASRWPSVDSVFVLERYHVGVAEVQVIGGPAIGFEIILAELESYFTWIIVAFGQIIDWHHKTLGRRKLLRDRPAQVVSERGNSTFARQIIAQEGDLFDFG